MRRLSGTSVAIVFFLAPSLFAAPKEAGAPKEVAAKKKPKTEAVEPAPAEPPAEPTPTPDAPPSAEPTAEPTPAIAVTTTSSTPAAPVAASPWFFELRVPLGRYARRRLSLDGGGAQYKTNVDAGLAASPGLRVFTPVTDWLALGGQLGAGFSSQDVDGSTGNQTLLTVALAAEARLMPWQMAWGYPHLTVGLGGLFVNGRFIETNASSASVTAIAAQGTAEVGFLLWLTKDVVALELGGSGGYAFGPGSLDDAASSGAFIQRLSIDVAAGVTAAF